MKRSWPDVAGLAILLAAFIIPTFAFASKISGDEYAKTLPAFLLASVIAIYKMWGGSSTAE